ncbi:structural maintenance of chromosomes protein 2 [Protopterus annectens]|uniref:structural maintenance of chromosomes protein 2 n=1 Tax=Protopterus annectens TaxID=7888 RepID=UPI001CFA349F|nr:structural maintenance of chromosomes protein 2 [Protopterus annectens]
MHIKSIIIDGFKSYAQRTEINGFDQLFNAITGLNGSGKSNILDSICFLLGISNLTQVRASNLQDLVYKNGQAGITKATVSITFDNTDKKQSPLGFETHDEITVTRQVVIGGRNKYLINGVNANNTRVQDLFCSVGLNVNNPHFLIMQGRITKVLNMKPPEILAMIEEAAGTRMYECKKIAAQKTIEKKEAKLKEIHTILEEEITPTLQKLKEVTELTSSPPHTPALLHYLIVRLSTFYLVALLQEVGGALRSLEEGLAELQRADAKAQSALDLKKQNLKGEEKKRKEITKSMEERIIFSGFECQVLYYHTMEDIQVELDYNPTPVVKMNKWKDVIHQETNPLLSLDLDRHLPATVETGSMHNHLAQIRQNVHTTLRSPPIAASQRLTNSSDVSTLNSTSTANAMTLTGITRTKRQRREEEAPIINTPPPNREALTRTDNINVSDAKQNQVQQQREKKKKVFGGECGGKKKTEELNDLVFNLSSRSLSVHEKSLLNKSLSFVPSQDSRLTELLIDIRTFARNVSLKLLFNNDSCTFGLNNAVMHKKKSVFIPDMPSNVNCFVQVCEQDFYQYFSKSVKESKRCPLFYNLSKEQQKALTHISNDQSLIVRPADKGGGLVVMDTVFYNNLMFNMLSNVKEYVPINDQELDRLIYTVHDNLYDLLMCRQLSKQLYEYCLIEKPLVPFIKGLPKMHKNKFPPPIRPLVAATMDVKNLFTTIPNDYGIEAVRQAQMKLKHAQQELKTKQAEVKKMDSGYKKDQDLFEAVKKSKEKLEAEMKKLNYEDGKEESLAEKRRVLSRDVNRLRETYETLMARFPNLRFEYKNPEKNWDSNRVKGLVASLITVKDVSTATALEVVAGGRLYNVVVDTEVTGKKILEKGELKRRYTIIPLNKISARSLDERTIKAAKNLVGHDKVHLALSLVGYESELQKAMQFVFGTTLVCDTLDNAKKVTFDKQVMTKTVTLGGDTFDPQGTLSGGARQQSSSVLANLQQLKAVKNELEMKETEIQTVEKELVSLKNTAEKYRQLKQQWEMKSEEAELLQAKLQQSSYHKQQEELESLKKIIDDSEETLKKTKEVQKKTEEKYKVLEDKMKNAEAEREKELKQAQQKLDAAKKKADASSKKMKEKQQEVDALMMELEELKREQTSYKQQLEAVDEALKSFQEQIDSMVAEVTKTKEAVKVAQGNVSKQKEVIMAKDKEIKTKSAEVAKLGEQTNECQLKIEEFEHNIDKLKQDSADAADRVAKMLQNHEWIASEKHLFGQTNTVYDFKANNPKEAGQRLQKLTEKEKKLGRNVNMRAMNMLSQAEDRYNDLMKKKRIVENDKAKILLTIEELDQKKNEALKIAWQKVNKDFGSIFSTLLPGANAMLAPPEGQGVLDGLEFKVALGSTWKENLTELSGGQRSLVALSLILAMLLFKPAPIYILDEVDAALDLSHTQNIGQMLRTHFRHSQFIVVSLKDGMFNNANVLFKTKFVDGVSTVTRFAQSQNASQNRPEKAKSRDKKSQQAVHS